MSYALRLALVSMIILIPVFASAQWVADPTVNLALGDGDGDQAVPHIAISINNSCYTGWYNTKSGNYDVGLQLLDASGNEMWPHGGIIVSDHPQESWVMDWSLISDSAGNAIVAFADIRDGNSNIHVYKIDPSGNFLWGENGVDITSNSDSKGPPSLVETNNGDIIVSWFADSTVHGSAIMIQRLSAAGIPQHSDNGIAASEGSDTMPSGQSMVPCGEDGFILAYVPSYSFMGNRQIKAQRFNADGQSVWDDYLMVMDNSSVPMGHYFEMMTDSNGGAFFSWTAVTGLGFSVRAQHVNSSGNESYPHNGVLLSGNSSYYQIGPSMAHDTTNNELTVFFVQMSSNQAQKGISGQRVNSTGGLMWGTNGQDILPVNTSTEGFVRAVETGNGVIGLSFQAPQSAYGQDQVISFMVDSDGGFVWVPSITNACTLPSSKDDLMATVGTDGMARFIWSDQRNGGSDVYGQNVNSDGSLGASLSPVSDLSLSLIHLGQNHPNPFNPSTDISFSLPSRQYALLRVLDTRGSVVRTLLDSEAGPGSETVRWDGRNTQGQAVPSGIYFYRLESGDSNQVKKMVLVK